MAYAKDDKDRIVADALHMMCTIGCSMSYAADQLDISKTTLCDWLLSDEHVAQYNRSRVIRADVHACEVNDYKRDMIRGDMSPEIAKIAISASQWQAGTMDSPRWSQKDSFLSRGSHRQT